MMMMTRLMMLMMTLMQVKTWYDRTRLEMIVTVLSAVDLPPRTGGQYR